MGIQVDLAFRKCARNFITMLASAFAFHQCISRLVTSSEHFIALRNEFAFHIGKESSPGTCRQTLPARLRLAWCPRGHKSPPPVVSDLPDHKVMKTWLVVGRPVEAAAHRMTVRSRLGSSRPNSPTPRRARVMPSSGAGLAASIPPGSLA